MIKSPGSKRPNQTPCIFLCLLLALTFLSWPSPVLSKGMIKSYTATQVYTDPEGKATGQGQVFVTPGKMRMDGMPGAGPGQNLSIIILEDKKLNYTINMDKKLYMEHVLTDKDMAAFGMDHTVQKEETVLGTETVNGFSCTKKKIISTVNIMGFSTKTTMTVWTSDRIAMPLRTRMQDGRQTELQGIQETTPKKSVFEIPKDFKKVDSIMELMGGMAGDGNTRTQGTGDTGDSSQMQMKFKEMMKKFNKPQ
ncbi:MAG: DUF4412 domain-containing protein [Pseudomonadota bacterium]